MNNDNQFWQSMLNHNVTHGLATVVCTGRSKWTLPGGDVLTNRRSAERAAAKLHKLMGGK